MTEKRFFKALFYSMIFFAATHIIVATFLTVTRLDLHYINVFYILGLNEIFPNIDKGIGSFLVSTTIILIVYAAFYLKQNNRKY
jgi:hypothetical protein